MVAGFSHDYLCGIDNIDRIKRHIHDRPGDEWCCKLSSLVFGEDPRRCQRLLQGHKRLPEGEDDDDPEARDEHADDARIRRGYHARVDDAREDKHGTDDEEQGPNVVQLSCRLVPRDASGVFWRVIQPHEETECDRSCDGAGVVEPSPLGFVSSMLDSRTKMHSECPLTEERLTSSPPWATAYRAATGPTRTVIHATASE